MLFYILVYAIFYTLGREDAAAGGDPEVRHGRGEYIYIYIYIYNKNKRTRNIYIYIYV